MRVKFSYWGLDRLGSQSVRSVEVPAGTTLDDFLGRLSASLDRDLRAETAAGGTRFITVNGAYSEVPQGLARKLEDGDEVAVLPFVAGG
jgi:molybdopterin converting factor small subunit